MKYSLFAIVCLIIHFIINFDTFRKKPTINIPAIKAYRIFVASIAVYFLTDLLWGVFEENKLPVPLYIDTTIYFAMMGFTILTWSHYVVKFLERKGLDGKIILCIGSAFFLAEVVLLIINVFHPVLFSIDNETCTYTAKKARNIMLYTQILYFLLLIVYSAFFAFKIKTSYRRKYIAVSSYSLIMLTVIVVQIFDPYLPMYSIGCVMGSVLINSYVINAIKEEYKEELAESRALVAQGQEQLNETKQIAYTDPLTGVKNKHAYVEEEERIDRLIAQNKMRDFAVVVFDLNGLKMTNDTKGHDAGDIYIIDACRTIEKYFGHENLYRFGGDEFVVILFNEQYKNRANLMNEFEQFIESCLVTDLPIISSGMSKYRKGADNTYHAVFYRADKIMYSRKEILKEHHNS